MCVLLIIIIFCYLRMRLETLSNVKKYFPPLLLKKIIIIDFFFYNHAFSIIYGVWYFRCFASLDALMRVETIFLW